jgi:hypothetical protein
MTSNSFEFRLKIYRSIWIGALLFTIAPRFTYFLKATGDTRFDLGLAFMLGTWLPLILVNALESARVQRYFKEYHGFRKGFLGFGFLGWFLSSDDFGDPNLAALKTEYRRFGRFAATVFFSYPLALIVIAL